MRTMGNDLRELMSNVAIRVPFGSQPPASGGCGEAGCGRQAGGHRRPRNPQSAYGHEDVALCHPGKCSRRRRLGAKTGHHFRRDEAPRKHYPQFSGFSRPMELYCRPTGRDLCAPRRRWTCSSERLEGSTEFVLPGPRSTGCPVRLPCPRSRPMRTSSNRSSSTWIGNALDAMAQDGKLFISPQRSLKKTMPTAAVWSSCGFAIPGLGMPVDYPGPNLRPVLYDQRGRPYRAWGSVIAVRTLMARHEGSLVHGILHGKRHDLCRLVASGTNARSKTYCAFTLGPLPRHPSAAPTAGS